MLIYKSSLAFPPLDWICSIFFFRLSGMPSELVMIFTVFVVAFQIQIIIDVGVVVNSFDIFLKFRVSRLKSTQSVFTKLFQFINESFAFIITQFCKGSRIFTFVLDYYLFWFDWFD